MLFHRAAADDGLAEDDANALAASAHWMKQRESVGREAISDPKDLDLRRRTGPAGWASCPDALTCNAATIAAKTNKFELRLIVIPHAIVIRYQMVSMYRRFRRRHHGG